MSKFLVTAAALLLAAPGWAFAQAAQAAQPASAAAKSESAEAQAAMERAQRLAANPMRVILQASKFKRKGAEPEPTPEAVDAASLRRTAARNSPAAEQAAGANAARSAAASPVLTAAATTSTASTAAAPAPAAAVVTPPPAPVPEPPQPKMMPASLLSGAAKPNVPALEIALPAEDAPVMSKAVAPQALPIVAAASRPMLVLMVEPEIPTRMMGDTGRVSEVMADLTLRQDGTVAEVAVLPPVPRNWKPYIVSALEKWRFQPMPGSVVHRVQLVFDDNK